MMMSRLTTTPSKLPKILKLSTRDRCFELGRRTMVMGVLNLTPDSFSRDGRLSSAKNDPVKNCDYALRMVEQGADIVDIGGESTRPDARPVMESEELKRIMPTLLRLRKKSKVVISIDTTKTEVARRALDAGADMVNNVKGTRATDRFLEIVARYEAAYVVMHSRGTPKTMQSMTTYKDLTGEIIAELKLSLEKCLDRGIKSDKIIVDPGVGFAKTAQQNFLLLKQLKKFQCLKRPILVGTSRKSFIGKLFKADASHRMWATAATVAAAICHGAHIIRVHDVKEMKQVALVTDAILQPSLADSL